MSNHGGNMIRIISLAAIVLLLGASATSQPSQSSSLLLWYAQPAREWNEALPLGNGRLAAMVFGGVERERVQLNEETFWSGGPYDPSRPDAAKALPEIQRLIFSREYMKAHTLLSRTQMGMPVEQMKYAPLANLILQFPDQGGFSAYRRELDIDKALASVTYRVGDVVYTREYFSSPIDQVIVIRLTASKPGNITFVANLQGVRNTEHSNYGTDYFKMDGEEPNSLVLRGRSADYLGVAGRLRHYCRLQASTEGGTVSIDDLNLRVSGADAATLVFAAATNFVTYKDVTGDPRKRVRTCLARLTDRSYEEMRRDHVAEHQRLFRRLSIDVGTTDACTLPTDERITKFSSQSDPQLAALFYQFARYILISSSRPGSLPANLQGKWNQDSNPMWDSKYTTNINTEMNYWIAEAGNLAECVDPLTKMMVSISRGPGVTVARKHYGAKGWVLHQNTDLFLACAPMDGPTWGTFTTAGAWLCTQLWDHYAFARDRAYLREIYPVLKGSVEFFLSTLVKHPTLKWLVTCPSTSPENIPKREGNGKYFDEITGLELPGTSICAGSTIDMEILRALFAEYAEAARILGIDSPLRAMALSVRGRLAPLQIDKTGLLQEWLEGWESLEPHHRHLSHLWGLYPGDHITPRETPLLAEAARKSLDARGDGASGWSQAWKMNLWARLLDGDRAFKLFGNLVTGSTLPNLFSGGGKVMQVDGLLGGASGIGETLLQSHNGEIALLPALPSAWAEGYVSGMRARGGFELAFEWMKGKLTSVTVYSLQGSTCRIRYGDIVTEIATKAGGHYMFNGELTIQ
jgi:alpha-L-fucosidase 2